MNQPSQKGATECRHYRAEAKPGYASGIIQMTCKACGHQWNIYPRESETPPLLTLSEGEDQVTAYRAAQVDHLMSRPSGFAPLRLDDEDGVTP